MIGSGGCGPGVGVLRNARALRAASSKDANRAVRSLVNSCCAVEPAVSARRPAEGPGGSMRRGEKVLSADFDAFDADEVVRRPRSRRSVGGAGRPLGEFCASALSAEFVWQSTCALQCAPVSMGELMFRRGSLSRRQLYRNEA